MPKLSFFPSPLTLGTVQLGLAYGITNTAGQPSDAEADYIIETAVRCGINVIDTARAYGNSEQRIGSWRAARPNSAIHIITKTPPLEGQSAREVRSALRQSIRMSCEALKVQRLDLVLAHRETDLLNPAIADAFVEAAAEGLIDAFGASLYSPEIGLKLIKTTAISAIQLPASLVDDRFQRAGVLAAAQTAGIAVFVRSVFLQGALLMDPKMLPNHLKQLASPLSAVCNFARSRDRPLIEVLILAMRDVPGVTSLVVGVERATQLQPLASAVKAPSLCRTEIDALRQVIGQLPDSVVNPSAWAR